MFIIVVGGVRSNKKEGKARDHESAYSLVVFERTSVLLNSSTRLSS